VFRYTGSGMNAWFSLRAYPETWTHGTNVAAGKF